MALEGIAAAGTAAAASAFGQWQTNKQNKKMAEQQMFFQERMANTPYTRIMSDARAAGINPILVAGGKADSPPGAKSESSDVLGKAAASALEASRLVRELKMMDSQKDNLDAETKLKKQQINRNKTKPSQIIGDGISNLYDRVVGGINLKSGQLVGKASSALNERIQNDKTKKELAIERDHFGIYKDPNSKYYVGKK